MAGPDFTTPARELVTRDTVCVDPDATLRAAARLLWEQDVGLLVVGTVEAPLGVLSERDVAGGVARDLDLDHATVREVMTDHIATARGWDPAYDLAMEMLDRGIRHVPVMDEHRVLGVVSLRDLIRPLVAGAFSAPESPD